jgi:hypothetical protein
MRACVLAVALMALAQPALARNHSHHASHHFSRHHHYQHHTRHHRMHYRVAPSFGEGGAAVPGNTMRTPAYAMRTNASDVWAWQQPAQTFTRRERSAVRQPAWQTSEWQQQSWQQQQQPAWQQPRAARASRAASASHGALDAMIARHAAANGLPVELVHRVVIRESRYNPGARNGPNLGLMQIQYRTARGVGYTGSPAGLLNAETNLTYAVRYLAGAYRAAGGNASRAVAYYASGYHGRGVRQPAAPTVQTAALSGTPSWGMQSQSVMMTDATSVRETRRSYRQRAVRAPRDQYWGAGAVMTGGV